MLFAEVMLGLKPFHYQQKLLRDASKRLVACMGRQTGKTTTIAVKAVHFAFCNANVRVLIASPSQRQSIIMFSKVADFVFRTILRGSVVRATQTSIHLSNGSEIIALPCSEHLLRGYTAHMIICLPAHTKVTLTNGEEIPINQIKAGDMVLSFNESTREIEPRKVLKLYRRPYQGKIMRLNHEFGYLECTPEHNVITACRGHKAAMVLIPRDKLLYLEKQQKLKHARRQSVDSASRAVSLWRTFRRFFSFKDNENEKEKKKKQLLANTAFLKTSRVCSIQVSDHERFRQNSTTHSEKQGLGERISEVFHTCISGVHKSTPSLLQKRSKNDIFRVVLKDNASPCISNLVHGRREPSLEPSDNNKHPLIYVRRTSNSSRMVKESLGCQSRDKKRQKGKGLLSAFPRGRERPIHGVNSTLHRSKYELQSNPESAFRQMPNLRKRIHPQKKCLHECPCDEEKANLPKPEMQKKSAFKAILQSIAHTMQNLWKGFHSPYGESSHMQQRMQSIIPFTTQTRVESCLQTEEKIKEVYNLNVEGNHNYFANGILVGNCDEAAFVPEEVVTNILYPMLATTDGSLILLSTPWGKDHFFYRAFVDPDFSVHRVKSRDCPLISDRFLKKQREFMTTETYRMEYEAEFAEAASSYFPQDLIRSCIDPGLELEHDLEVLGRREGDFYGGCDLGKLQDYSVFVVVQKTNDLIKLVFLREFPLETSYSSVIGFVVRANQKFGFQRILIDKSGVGEIVTEEIKAQGLTNAEGKSFTAQSKAEMLANLRVKMEQGAFKMPYNHRLCQQINEQRYEYIKSGQLRFWHPPNSHDDQLWSLALAVYATRESDTKGSLARAW